MQRVDLSLSSNLGRFTDDLNSTGNTNTFVIYECVEDECVANIYHKLSPVNNSSR